MFDTPDLVQAEESLDEKLERLNAAMHAAVHMNEQLKASSRDLIQRSHKISDQARMFFLRP